MTYEIIDGMYNSKDIEHHTSSGTKKIKTNENMKFPEILAYVEQYEEESGKKAINFSMGTRSIYFFLK